MRNLFILAFFTLFLLSNDSFAQTKIKSDDPLNQFLNTEFMDKFMEMKVAAESTARTFKSQSEQGVYSADDQRRVELAYNRTAEKFNYVLRGIKEDLLDKKKLKYISKFPDDYQKELELDMYKLSDYYSNNYQQVIADVTNSEVDGVAIFLLINGIINSSTGIFQLVKGIVNYSAQRKKMNRAFSEKRLEEVLMKPHTWALWHELGKGETNNEYGGENNYNNESENYYDNSQDNLQFQYTEPLEGERKSKAEKEADEAEARARTAEAKAREAEAKRQLENGGSNNGSYYEEDESYYEDETVEYDENGNVIDTSIEETNSTPVEPSGSSTTSKDTSTSQKKKIEKKKASTINIAIPVKTKKAKKTTKKKNKQ
jgi:hypothetical protein